MLYSSEQRGGRTAFHQLSTDLGPEALPCIFDLTFEQEAASTRVRSWANDCLKSARTYGYIHA